MTAGGAEFLAPFQTSIIFGASWKTGVSIKKQRFTFGMCFLLETAPWSAQERQAWH